MIPKNVKWAAEIDRVREVWLDGVSRASYWRAPLRAANLELIETGDGQAQVRIVASSAQFMGLPFRELSISVNVRDAASTATPEPAATDTAPEQIALLVGAYNSLRAFAWIERRIFSTPYEHASITVAEEVPAAISVTRGDKAVFVARMGGAPRTEWQAVDDASWEGMIRLADPVRRFVEESPGPVPARNPALGTQPSEPAAAASWPGSVSDKIFFARLMGAVRRFPYLPGDLLELNDNTGDPLIETLLESEFEPREWTLRPHGRHAKSRTYTVEARAGSGGQAL